MAAPPGTLPRRRAGYSDVILAIGAVTIIAVMILPLPLTIIDTLVAINIAIGFGLLLIALYIPTPVAFSSFPSVLLLTTLFRLSLSIAITRSILLEANGGHIVETFGSLVAGGNLVVGFVVFLIITVVQFIVIAKGAERVAEVGDFEAHGTGASLRDPVEIESIHRGFLRARIQVGSRRCRIGQEQHRALAVCRRPDACTQGRRSDGPSPFAGEHSRHDRKLMSRRDDLAVSEEVRHYPDHERSTTSTRMW